MRAALGRGQEPRREGPEARDRGCRAGRGGTTAEGEMSDTYDLFQQGRRHLRNGMPAQATVALEKAKRREPRSRSIREALGIAYFRLRRWGEAEAEFRALVELSPTDDYAHYALARTLVNQGRRKEATPHIKLAHSLRPRRPADERL